MKFELPERVKKFFGQIMNTKYVAIIFIVGIALIALPSTEKPEEKQDKGNVSELYKEKIKTELEKIISEIKGAGEVSVMITFSDDGNTLYAVNESYSSSGESENKTKSSEKEYVLKSEGGSAQEALVTKKVCPEISGVLICAKGAGNPEKKSNITRAVEALLGIKSHRVEVLERK